MADPDIFKRGRGRKTTCLPRRHLSQMHIVNYTRFYEKSCLLKKTWGQRGVTPRSPHPWICHCMPLVSEVRALPSAPLRFLQHGDVQIIHYFYCCCKLVLAPRTTPSTRKNEKSPSTRCDRNNDELSVWSCLSIIPMSFPVQRLHYLNSNHDPSTNSLYP